MNPKWEVLLSVIRLSLSENSINYNFAVIVGNATKTFRKYWKKMNKIYTRKVEYDFEGYAIIEIPEEICEELDLHLGDVLVYEIKADSVILRKRLEY